MILPAEILFIRHSLPILEPSLPANQWVLSAEGRQRAKLLAGRLAGFHPQRIIASHEPKASETAQIMAEALGLPRQTAPGLHEHLRSRTGYTSQADFEAAIQAFFAQPDRLVFGNETADEAYRRFAQAVETVRGQYTGQGILAIVSHGTVITLYVSRKYRLDPFPFWKSLALPCLVNLTATSPQILSLESPAEPNT